MMNKQTLPDQAINVVWFRRDLRLEDHTALTRALNAGKPVLPLFIFDSNILDELEQDDARVTFIYEQLELIQQKLISRGSSFHVYKGDPLGIWKSLIDTCRISGVYVNKDYEPYAIRRDMELSGLLESRGIPFYQYKDQVIFEEGEVVKEDGKPYTVFTPYRKKWLEKFRGSGSSFVAGEADGEFLRAHPSFPRLEALGFKASELKVGPFDLSRLDEYPALRDLPAADATSHLSPHLRFGTVSIRKIVESLGPSDGVFLSELIWREFFMQILFHFPRVVSENFKSRYDGIPWRNREDDFLRWCQGQTGYPMVDAGMRQLNESGTMHNRVRMICAGFLCKHLLTDWRMGEGYFAGKLLDYELSSNNGNWQWAAGTGCDAAPYFRVFNPSEQLRKFDPDLEYVRRWVPEYGTSAYPAPMVDHKLARERAIQVYRKGLSAIKETT